MAAEQLTKICRDCGVEKPLDDFYPYKKKIAKTGRQVRFSRCKPCSGVFLKAHRESRKRADPAWLQQRQIVAKRWRANNRERYLRTLVGANLRKKGITIEDYESMLAAQRGGCAICGATTNWRGASVRLSVDHDHATGAVRGLLCQNCNSGIGQMRDSPGLLRAAIAYLERHRPEPMEAARKLD